MRPWRKRTRIKNSFNSLMERSRRMQRREKPRITKSGILVK